MREFQRQFATEEACQDYLAACRWPDGFACPRCRHRRAYRMKALRRWQCAACRYQVSLTAGTILHNTKTALTVWFWATYLTVTDKRGMSALLLQRQLGLRRYETAWMLLHKLRRAMVNAARERLHWRRAIATCRAHNRCAGNCARAPNRSYRWRTARSGISNSGSWALIMASVAISFRSTSTNSLSDTTVDARQRQPFRPCSASGQHARPLRTDRFGALGTWRLFERR